MPSEQLIEIEEVDGLVAVRFLVPDIADAEKTLQIWDAIIEIAGGGCHTMLFDLGGVQHSSSAFNVLLYGAWKRLKSTGRRLAFCACDAKVMEILSCLPFDEFFATREEAIAKLTLPSSLSPPPTQ